jgi:hypothetical protein
MISSFNPDGRPLQNPLAFQPSKCSSSQLKGDAPPVLAAGDLRHYQRPSRSQSRSDDRIHKEDDHNNDTQDLPPPPPPKDSFCLYNRSLASLPTTPQSSNFPHALSPNPTHSTMSLALTAASAIDSSTSKASSRARATLPNPFSSLLNATRQPQRAPNYLQAWMMIKRSRSLGTSRFALASIFSCLDAYCLHPCQHNAHVDEG